MEHAPELIHHGSWLRKRNLQCHLQQCASFIEFGMNRSSHCQVPVYEFNVEGNHVMRRRYDNFINATHILKVADYDKPARTRILEREVQKGPHEKIQGGYGKYQGTVFSA